MKHHFRKYSEILFMDTTYNVRGIRYLQFWLRMGTGGVNQWLTATVYVRSETKEHINKVLDKFCEHNDVTGVGIVMADKDLNEMNAIKEHIPNATILLCKFHVMKY